MRRAGTAVYVHVVWPTWHRLPLLTGELVHQIYRAIGAKCTELGAEVVALGGIEDHVHLLVRLPSALSVAELARQVKGVSSHLATHTLLGRDDFFKWQGAYGAVSVSPRHLPQVSAYVAHQREHHAAGSLIAALEDTGRPWPKDGDKPVPATTDHGPTENTR